MVAINYLRRNPALDRMIATDANLRQRRQQKMRLDAIKRELAVDAAIAQGLRDAQSVDTSQGLPWERRGSEIQGPLEQMTPSGMASGPPTDIRPSNTRVSVSLPSALRDVVSSHAGKVNGYEDIYDEPIKAPYRQPDMLNYDLPTGSPLEGLSPVPNPEIPREKRPNTRVIPSKPLEAIHSGPESLEEYIGPHQAVDPYKELQRMEDQRLDDLDRQRRKQLRGLKPDPSQERGNVNPSGGETGGAIYGRQDGDVLTYPPEMLLPSKDPAVLARRAEVLGGGTAKQQTARTPLASVTPAQPLPQSDTRIDRATDRRPNQPIRDYIKQIDAVVSSVSKVKGGGRIALELEGKKVDAERLIMSRDDAYTEAWLNAAMKGVPQNVLDNLEKRISLDNRPGVDAKTIRELGIGADLQFINAMGGNKDAKGEWPKKYLQLRMKGASKIEAAVKAGKIHVPGRKRGFKIKTASDGSALLFFDDGSVKVPTYKDADGNQATYKLSDGDSALDVKRRLDNLGLYRKRSLEFMQMIDPESVEVNDSDEPTQIRPGHEGEFQDIYSAISDGLKIPFKPGRKIPSKGLDKKTLDRIDKAIKIAQDQVAATLGDEHVAAYEDTFQPITDEARNMYNQLLGDLLEGVELPESFNVGKVSTGLSGGGGASIDPDTTTGQAELFSRGFSKGDEYDPKLGQIKQKYEYDPDIHVNKVVKIVSDSRGAISTALPEFVEHIKSTKERPVDVNQDENRPVVHLIELRAFIGSFAERDADGNPIPNRKLERVVLDYLKDNGVALPGK